MPDPDTGKICAPLEKFCHGQDLLLCQGDGVSVLIVETCPLDQGCDAALGCTCTPECGERECGDDSCEGSCGSCGEGKMCSLDGACVPICVPSCAGKACGGDGCGGPCGSCGLWETCQPDGTCQCVPACAAKACGDDGCGGSCGTCAGNATCVEDGTCVTDPPVGGICGITGYKGKPLGSPCTAHSECATGYCYDEALWNEDGQQKNRFCTAACGACMVVANCSEWPKADGAGESKCYPFTGAFVSKHSLTANSVCLPTCKSDADCKALTPYDRCAPLAYGTEANSGVYKVCQPESYPLPEQ